VFQAPQQVERISGRDQFDTSDAAAPEYLAHAHLGSFVQETLGNKLRAMREPELSAVSSETYRFLWLRSFHAPISVQITWTKPELWTPDLSEHGHDGATWIVETKVKERYSFAKTWSPEHGAIRERGLHLLRLSGLPLEPIY
jgi:hypothetical protein